MNNKQIQFDKMFITLKVYLVSITPFKKCYAYVYREKGLLMRSYFNQIIDEVAFKVKYKVPTFRLPIGYYY